MEYVDVSVASAAGTLETGWVCIPTHERSVRFVRRKRIGRRDGKLTQLDRDISGCKNISNENRVSALTDTLFEDAILIQPV